MIRPSILYKRNFTSVLNKLKEKVSIKVRAVELPERYKGTIIEKWKDYWVNLIKDYSDVAKDTAVSAKKDPKKTFALLSLFGFGVYCFKTNPDETSYRDTLLSYSADLMLIGPTIRNPAAKRYLEEIENYYNEGVVNRLSLGLFSLIWKDDYNSHVGIYKSQCSYLALPFYRFYENVIDVGFMNKWHVLSKKMVDFDVNPDEWKVENP